jgi:hypothetical protein
LPKDTITQPPDNNLAKLEALKSPLVQKGEYFLSCYMPGVINYISRKFNNKNKQNKIKEELSKTNNKREGVRRALLKFTTDETFGFKLHQIRNKDPRLTDEEAGVIPGHVS